MNYAILSDELPCSGGDSSVEFEADPKTRSPKWQMDNSVRHLVGFHTGGDQLQFSHSLSDR